MKKTKLIVISIVIALLLVGAAYAAWTAQTNVTVNAGSGELNVDITDTSVESVSNGVEFSSSSILISEDKKSATVSIGNMYPGSSVEFSTIISNTGTIPVELDRITHAALGVIDRETGKSLGLDEDVFANFQAAYSVTVLDENGKKLDSLNGYTTEKQKDWVEDIYANNNLEAIPVGGSLVVDMKVYLEEEATDITENKLFRFSITPQFMQAN